jgi:hypothetical protein
MANLAFGIDSHQEFLVQVSHIDNNVYLVLLDHHRYTPWLGFARNSDCIASHHRTQRVFADVEIEILLGVAGRCLGHVENSPYTIRLKLVTLDSFRGKEGRVVGQGESRETGGKGCIYKIVYHEL